MSFTRSTLRFPVYFKRAVQSALAHDCLNLAQSAAYSAMVALFPALIVAAAAIAFLPGVVPLRYEIAAFFGQILPADVFPLLTSYFVTSAAAGAQAGVHTGRALTLAGLVSLSGASNILVTLMDGMHRAAGLPRDPAGFWQRRLRALALVPVSLVPLAVASILVVFGRLITQWVAGSLSLDMRTSFYALAVLLRWLVALAGVAGLTATIYHLGLEGRHAGRGGGSSRARWIQTLPGAIVATAMWFLTTLAFGWYVTRFANYNQVYGSLGAGIALLFWLYIVFFSVLCGAEFNAQLSAPSRMQPGAGRMGGNIHPDALGN